MKAMGIDIGTTTVSVILMDADSGALLASRTLEHQAFLQGAASFHRIQDPQKIWELVQQAVKELSEAFGAPDSIGLTGQMHGVLYVDAQGEAVSPLYTWQDGCGNEKMSDGRSYAQALQEAVGTAASGYGLTTHFYLQKTGQIPEKAEKMVTISDYIGMKLCQKKEAVIARDMAASWGCFDMEQSVFYTEKLEAAGVDVSLLPTVLKQHEILGHTTGICGDGIPVMASLGDNQASVIGSVQSPCDTVLLNIGTGSQVSFGTDRYLSCEGSMEIRPCTDNDYMLVGSGLCGGRAYAMLEQFYREIHGTGESLYSVMEQQARAFLEQQGADAAWKVRTTFSGTRSNPQERGSIQGIGVENFTPGAMTLGMLKGILAELFEMYEEMCRMTGTRAKRLVASGNGIRKNSLMQELAEELFQMKMEIPVCREEAAYGAALHSLVSAGLAASLQEVQKKIHYMDRA